MLRAEELCGEIEEIFANPNSSWDDVARACGDFPQKYLRKVAVDYCYWLQYKGRDVCDCRNSVVGFLHDWMAQKSDLAETAKYGMNSLGFLAVKIKRVGMPRRKLADNFFIQDLKPGMDVVIAPAEKSRKKKGGGKSNILVQEFFERGMRVDGWHALVAKPLKWPKDSPFKEKYKALYYRSESWSDHTIQLTKVAINNLDLHKCLRPVLIGMDEAGTTDSTSEASTWESKAMRRFKHTARHYGGIMLQVTPQPTTVSKATREMLTMYVATVDHGLATVYAPDGSIWYLNGIKFWKDAKKCGEPYLSYPDPWPETLLVDIDLTEVMEDMARTKVDQIDPSLFDTDDTADTAFVEESKRRLEEMLELLVKAKQMARAEADPFVSAYSLLKAAFIIEYRYREKHGHSPWDNRRMLWDMLEAPPDVCNKIFAEMKDYYEAHRGLLDTGMRVSMDERGLYRKWTGERIAKRFDELDIARADMSAQREKMKSEGWDSDGAVGA